MTDATLWWIAAGSLVAAELLSGTLYLLMLAVGMVAGALAAHAGLAQPWQWSGAALIGGASVLVLWRLKRAGPPTPPAAANPDVNLDVGAEVQVQAWHPDGSCRVRHRGAVWDAALLPGEPAGAGAYTIAEIVGSRLLLRKSPHP